MQLETQLEMRLEQLQVQLEVEVELEVELEVEAGLGEMTQLEKLDSSKLERQQVQQALGHTKLSSPMWYLCLCSSR